MDIRLAVLRETLSCRADNGTGFGAFVDSHIVVFVRD